MKPGDALRRPVRELAPQLVWGSLVFWSTLGMVAAVQVWTRPGVHPGLPFLALVHVPHWSLWAVLSLVVLSVHQRLGVTNAPGIIALHVPLGIAVIACHAAAVAAWDLVVIGSRFHVSWSAVFLNHLHGSLVTEALGYVVVLAAALLVVRRSAGSQAERPPESPQSQRSVRALPIRVGDDVVMVEPREIRYVEAAKNYARIFTAERRLPVRQSLTALEAILTGRFVRVHRSILVNLDHVARLRSTSRWRKSVVLKGGPELPASADGWRRIRAQFVSPEETDDVPAVRRRAAAPPDRR